jgi:uncharacterized protein YndB with AHSA1/START domain
MPFHIELRIARDPSDVFAYLADSTNTPKWYEAVDRAEPLDAGVVDVGKRYRFERHLPGGPAVNTVEVAEFVPGRAVTLASVDGPTPFRYRYTIGSDGEAGTLLRLDGEIRGDGLRGPVAALAPLAPALFARGMRVNLERLKGILEGG